MEWDGTDKVQSQSLRWMKKPMKHPVMNCLLNWVLLLGREPLGQMMGQRTPHFVPVAEQLKPNWTGCF